MVEARKEIKKLHATYWGLGGSAMSVGCGVGMFFTGPVGWVCLAAGIGTGVGVTVSSVQQYRDAKQEDFEFNRAVGDGATGLVIGGTAGLIGAVVAFQNSEEQKKFEEDPAAVFLAIEIALKASIQVHKEACSSQPENFRPKKPD